MKRTFSLLLALLMLFCVLPLSANAEENDIAITGVLSDSGVTGGCRWSLYDSTLTISKDTGTHMENYDDEVFPPYLEYADKITSIVISEGVTDIGNTAFSDLDKVESLSLPDGLKVIGRYAFSGCTSLKSVIMPDTVTKMGSGAFFNTGIESLKISSNIIYIYDYSFASCPKLRSVTIPDSVKYLGPCAFCNYAERPKLRSVTIPDSVKYLDPCAFCNYAEDDSGIAQDYALESVTLSANLEYISERAFEGCNKLWRVILPDSVTDVGERAFAGCSSLQSVTLSKNMYRIANSAFMDCASLSYVDIPGNIKIIEENAFYQCSSLYNVHLSDGVEKILDQSFLETGMRSVMIPPSVEVIAYHAFVHTHKERRQYKQGDYIYCVDKDVADEAFLIYGAPGSMAETFANRISVTFADARYHMVSFDANGGYGTMDSVNISVYEKFYLPECKIEPPSGKEFSHWTLGVSGTQYNAGALCKITDTTIFFAQWKTPPTPKTVSSVYISGWPEATAGQSAADNPPAGACSSRYYRLIDSHWFTVERVSGQPAKYVEFNGVFEEGKDYVARYTVDHTPVSVFADTVTVSFADGSSQDVVPQRGGFIRTYVSVRVTASQTEYVNSVSLSITAPSAGAKPDHTVVKTNRSSCDLYTTGLGFLVPNGTGLEFIDHSKGVPNNSPMTEVAYYMTSDETFKVGGKYTARIFLTTGSREDTFFGKNFSALINGARAEVCDTSGGKETLVWAEYTFTVSGSTLIGDVNVDGKVNNRDAMILDRYIAGWENYDMNIKNIDAADLNSDGSVNNRDAMILDRYVAGWAGYDKYIVMV